MSTLDERIVFTISLVFSLLSFVIVMTTTVASIPILQTGHIVQIVRYLFGALTLVGAAVSVYRLLKIDSRKSE